MTLNDKKIAVIGLGYVGLPLCIEFGKLCPVVGFDVDLARVEQLGQGHDSTLEVTADELESARYLSFTHDADALKSCNIFIVTVPTPIDRANRPDLKPLIKASETIGKAMSPGAIVIYESTVYPGCTREVCVPILEQVSGLTFNKDFFAGYSPERINPGDRERRLPNVIKVTAGSTPEISIEIEKLYGAIVTAGIHPASSIEVAEAAKVIENTQRDLNIALMNELAIIFNRLGIDTLEVLEAAGSKWNFLPFRPGLVGGHCIGVDPYYLTHKAQEAGYHPEVILAGRRINDGMGEYVADEMARLMMKKSFPVVGSRILVMGLTFKENCPDLRNSKVINIVRRFSDYNANIDVYDPWVDTQEAQKEFAITCLNEPPDLATYEGIIVAVGHRQFLQLGPKGIREFGKQGAIFYDVKSLFAKTESDGRL